MNLAAALLKVGLPLGCAFSAAGIAAPIYPPFEIANHFRPMIVLGCAALIGLRLMARPTRGWLLIAALTMLNVVLLLLPLRLEARRADAHPAMENHQHSFSVLSLNVWANNTRLEAVADNIRVSNADIVALQKLPARNAAILLPHLKADYPHQIVCGRCRNLALLSKRPWIGIEEQAVSAEQPGLLIATFANGTARWRLAVLHPSYPFRPFEQARDYAWLTSWVARQKGTLVMAVDFNLTPWTWKMWRLQRSTGMVRHGTWGHSWSGHLPLQTFLIDNVLTTPDVRAVAFTTGTNVGSDHLPIVARIALPGS